MVSFIVMLIFYENTTDYFDDYLDRGNFLLTVFSSSVKLTGTDGLSSSFSSDV